MFSDGSTNLLQCLRSAGSFPPGWSKTGGGRVAKNTSLSQWLYDLINSTLDGDVGRCQVEDNLAVFGIASTPNKGATLSYANIQAIITDGGSIEDYCYAHTDDSNKNAISATYYRLDYDPLQPGPMFKEAVPHIHVAPHGAPRFDLPGASTGDILMAFIDFIYRNHFYEKHWLPWARKVWKKHLAVNPQRGDPLPRVEYAFTSTNQVSLLTSSLAPYLKEIRSVLTKAQQPEEATAHIDVKLSQALSFRSD